MYVLCAMEAVKNHEKLFSVTQLAAMRVDANWIRKDTFHRPIEPIGPSFHLWQDPAFTGYSKQEFLNAEHAVSVLNRFTKWLQPDDILCWWDLNEKNVFVKFFSMTKKFVPSCQMLDLKSYFHMAVQDGNTLKGNVFKLSSVRGISTTGEEHCALDRVYAMSSFLQGVALDQTLLENPAQERIVERDYDPKKGHAYVYQPETGYFHQADCPKIKQNSKMEGFGSLNGCMKHHFKPCPACALKDVNAWRRKRNKESIENSAYEYVFALDGNVFHRKSCAIVLGAKHINGFQKYRTCIQHGMRPCKVCKPVPIVKEKKKKPIVCSVGPVRLVKEKKPKKILLPRSNWLLSEEAAKAIMRFAQAQKERKSWTELKDMNRQEKADHMTLTHPGYAFFAGRGYQTFHLRSCSALNQLTEIKGFPTFERAEAAGKVPCKRCKPTPKADLAISIPISNLVRENESEKTLIALCEAKGIVYRYIAPYFYMETRVGKWKINTLTRPVVVHHINLVHNPNGAQYHKQHRLFLSLKDTFDYIVRHDDSLEHDSVQMRNVGD